MASFKFLSILIVTIITAYLFYGFLSEVPLPDVNLNEWWGPETTRHKQNTNIRPFRINFNESMVKDLKDRLLSYRSPVPTLEGITFEYGFNSKELDVWIKYWAKEYQFKEQEKFLNQFPQYKTNIQGLDIHFVRVKSKDTAKKEVVPLLILHGWPGSVREFYETIPILTAVGDDKDFAVEVIAPSLPGYGFSDAAVRPGLGADKMAVVFRNLMHRLGYKKFYIQGGDWGACISINMATFFPDEVLGCHLNSVFTQTPQTTILTLLGAIYPPMMLGDGVVDRMYPLSKIISFYLEETGYLHIQATKPDTVGVGLSDSPAGLAAYILEKISIGTRRSHRSHPDGGLSAYYTKNQLIDNLMIYWTSNSITSSMRIYAESFSKRYLALKLNEIKSPVPMWALQARHEIAYLPPWMVRMKFPNLLNETVLLDGGHFAAMEMPEVFAQDVLEAISAFRAWWRLGSVAGFIEE